MSRKLISLFLLMIAISFLSCSSENAKLMKGKWVLANQIIGRSPTSYWFQKYGKVIAPWEDREISRQSSGRYEFIEDTHIKIVMNKGFYKEITFFFEIVKVDKEELILRGSIQDIRMRRVE